MSERLANLGKKNSGSSGAIFLGSIAPTTAGATATIDCTSVPNYQALTSNDFLCVMNSTRGSQVKISGGNLDNILYIWVPQVQSYDARNGILTITGGYANIHMSNGIATNCPYGTDVYKI